MSTANFQHIKAADEVMQKSGEVVKFSPPIDFKGALYLGTRGSALVSGEIWHLTFLLKNKLHTGGTDWGLKHQNRILYGSFFE